jgi:uncharacterized membrane protein
MVLMAIDHVRVYAGVPPGGPDPAVFFTRWVTHFCAPLFVFLAGTAAFLYGEKVASRSALARFLALRGLWLILLELTLLRFAWTFNFDYANFTFAGVIWVIGAAMLVLAALVGLGPRATGVIGLLIVFGHNLIASSLYAIDDPSWWLRLLYIGGGFEFAGLNVAILYVLLPWAGTIAAGYGFGLVMRLDIERRRRACFAIGGAAVALFVVLRATGIYGDPNPWSASVEGIHPALAFLSTAKYPASLLFLLMTIGPAILVLPLLETAKGRVAAWLRVFGEVPFFYYVLHIPLIHLAAVAVAAVRTPDQIGWLVANHPLLPPDVPDGYRWSLALLYAVTLLVVVALYFPCRWYARKKGTAPRPWMRWI